MATDESETGTRGGAAPAFEKRENAAKALREILDRMGIDAEVSAFDDGERIILDAHGAESGLIIGKKGATLDALQYVVNRIISKKPNDGPVVVVDAEGYREPPRGLARRSGAPARGQGGQERASCPRRADEPARSAHRSRHARRSPGRDDRIRR